MPAEDIAANKYDLSINRYKEVEYRQEQYEDPKVILQRLKGLEQEILADLDELEGCCELAFGSDWQICRQGSDVEPCCWRGVYFPVCRP